MLFSHNVHTVLKFWSGFVFAGMVLPNFGSIKNLSQILWQLLYRLAQQLEHIHTSYHHAFCKTKNNYIKSGKIC